MCTKAQTGPYFRLCPLLLQADPQLVRPLFDWLVHSHNHQVADNIALQYGFWFWRDNSTHTFTQLVANTEGSTYFCINFPADLQASIIQVAKEGRPEICKPLFLDTMVADGLLKSYRHAIEDQRAALLRIVCLSSNPSIKVQER